MIVEKCINHQLADVTDQKKNGNGDLDLRKPGSGRQPGQWCCRENPGDDSGYKGSNNQRTPASSHTTALSFQAIPAFIQINRKWSLLHTPEIEIDFKAYIIHPRLSGPINHSFI